MRAPKKAKAPIVRLTASGRCEANCTKLNCPRGMQPIVDFLPAVSNRNHRKRAAMEKILQLDREMGRSRMLCMNCGHVETQARQRAPGPSEEGN